MAKFYSESITLTYSSVETAKRWWIHGFACKAVKVPADWDNPLPSDVALQFPGADGPTILLSSKSEVNQAGFDRPSPVATVIFCDKLKKAHEHLGSRGLQIGPIEDGGDMEFFEIRDVEGNLLQICKER